MLKRALLKAKLCRKKSDGFSSLFLIENNHKNYKSNNFTNPHICYVKIKNKPAKGKFCPKTSARI